MTIQEFENKWLQKIRNELLKSFPDDFIEFENFDILELPQKPLLKGSELFGSYEIIDTNGNPFISVDNSSKMKYILYSNFSNPSSIRIPLEISEMKNSVKMYEKYLDEIIKMIETDYKKNFRGEKDFTAVSNRIFKLLNLTRH